MTPEENNLEKLIQRTEQLKPHEPEEGIPSFVPAKNLDELDKKMSSTSTGPAGVLGSENIGEGNVYYGELAGFLSVSSNLPCTDVIGLVCSVVGLNNSKVIRIVQLE